MKYSPLFFPPDAMKQYLYTEVEIIDSASCGCAILDSLEKFHQLVYCAMHGDREATAIIANLALTQYWLLRLYILLLSEQWDPFFSNHIPS